MRSTEERVERLACAEHCRFFKPWSGEVRRCSAYRWLVARAHGDERLLEELERLRGQKGAAGPLAHDAALLRAVCTRCDYYPDACAYRKPAGNGNPDPCGGLVVLALLIQRDAISVRELYDPPAPDEGSEC